MGGISIVSSILLLNVDETNGKGLTEILKKNSVASVAKLEERSFASADKLKNFEAKYKDFEVWTNCVVTK